MSRRISRQYQARAILLLRNFIAFQFFKEVLNLVEKTIKIKNFFKEVLKEVEKLCQCSKKRNTCSYLKPSLQVLKKQIDKAK